MRVAPPTRGTDAPVERHAGLSVVLIAIIWAVAAAATLGVASETAVGPVVLRLSEGHGIHLGDIIFGFAAIISASAATWLSGRR
jgi:hypothetical protein